MKFHAERILESPQEKRADIRAKKGADLYVIEEKSRLDHPDLISKVAKTPMLQVVEYQKELSRSNRLSGIIYDAVKQLEATPKEGEEFHCMWFRAAESLIPDATQFMKATLYGIKYLLVNDPKKGLLSKPCYYFDFSEFFKYPILDAVILDENNNMQLCANSFSARAKQFSHSELYRFFAGHKAVIDPIELEKSGQIYVADTIASRKEQQKIIEYLESKYSSRVRTLKMNVHGGIVQCSRQEADQLDMELSVTTDSNSNTAVRTISDMLEEWSSRRRYRGSRRS